MVHNLSWSSKQQNLGHRKFLENLFFKFIMIITRIHTHFLFFNKIPATFSTYTYINHLYSSFVIILNSIYKYRVISIRLFLSTQQSGWLHLSLNMAKNYEFCPNITNFVQILKSLFLWVITSFRILIWDHFKMCMWQHTDIFNLLWLIPLI